jgi:DNA-binding transcriptional MerR regulator
MYNIKEAAARAGISVPVLRAWERRYGSVSPERSASGYRRFDDASVARVRTMRSLVDDGWSPSAAAAAILQGQVRVEDRAPDSLPGGRVAGGVAAEAQPPSASEAAAEIERLGAELVRAAAALDAAALDVVLDELFSRSSFERAAGDILFPALRRLGDAWARGEVSVAGEHLASSAILRRLGQALEAAGSHEVGGRRVVVGLPPNGRHELGALAFAVAARRAGLSIAYVGPDLPAADWVTATANAAGAVIGVVRPQDRRGAIEVARSIRAANPSLVVAFGGRFAPEEPDVLRLDGSLAASVATLTGALEGPPA